GQVAAGVVGLVVGGEDPVRQWPRGSAASTMAACAGRRSGARAGGGKSEGDHGRCRGGQRCQQGGETSHARILSSFGTAIRDSCRPRREGAQRGQPTSSESNRKVSYLIRP